MRENANYTGYFERLGSMSTSHISVEPIQNAEIADVVNLVKSSLDRYEEAGTVLASIYRRIQNFHSTYFNPYSFYLVARDLHSSRIIGGVGIGPLAGLPISEGVGEIRELVIAPDYRGRGLGTRLLQECLKKGKKIGFKQIYLETTPQMEHAQKLFYRFGFRAVRHHTSGTPDVAVAEDLPFYFLLEDIDVGLSLRRVPSS